MKDGKVHSLVFRSGNGNYRRKRCDCHASCGSPGRGQKGSSNGIGWKGKRKTKGRESEEAIERELRGIERRSHSRASKASNNKMAEIHAPIPNLKLNDGNSIPMVESILFLRLVLRLY